jgi:3-oxoacyl-[acyl-carrier protein] reductase
MAQQGQDMRSLIGRVALITGAAHGMGRETARLFAETGAHVAVTDIDGEAAREAADAITRDGGSARAWTLDVTDAAAACAVAAEVAGAWGRLDILVNNAGIGSRLPIDDPGYEANWARLLDLLLTAQQRLIRAALPHLRASDGARIVNIASTEALGGTTGNTAYAAAKAGVVGLTRTLAVELGREGITVNCICPGPVLTEITKRIPEADRDRFARRRTALGRYGRAEEVAHMTLSLCLPAASYVTGVVLPVDGGLTARNA